MFNVNRNNEDNIITIALCVHIYIIMWSCPGNMPKYYPGLLGGEGNMSLRPG